MNRLWRVFLYCSLLLTLVDSSNAQRAELVVEAGNATSIGRLALSPDGKLLASGSYNGTAKVWDVASGKLIKNLTVSPMRFSGALEEVQVAFSPDGKLLATFSENVGVYLWDVTADTNWKPLVLQDATFAESFAFSPDGRTIVVTGSSGVEVWYVSNLRKKDTFETGESIQLLAHPAVNPKRPQLAASSYEGIVLWDMNTKAVKRIKTPDSPTPYRIEFSPGGDVIAAIEGRRDDSLTPPSYVPGSQTGYRSTTLTPDRVTLWSADSGQKIDSIPCEAIEDFTFAPDGGLWTTCGGEVFLWDLKTKSKTGLQIKGPSPLMGAGVTSLAVSGNGRLLAGRQGDRLKVWDLSDGHETAFEMRNMAVDSLRVSPSGRQLAGIATLRSSDTESGFTVWDTAVGRVNMSVAAGVRDFAFSPDDKLIAAVVAEKGSGGLYNVFDTRLRLWDAASGAQLEQKFEPVADYYAGNVEFSPDGRYLAVCAYKESGWALFAKDYEGVVMVYEVGGGLLLGPLPQTGATTLNWHAGFSRDGKRLLIDNDLTTEIWNINAKTRLAKGPSTDEALKKTVAGFAPTFYDQTEDKAPVGKVQAEVAPDGVIKLYSVEDGSELASLISLRGGEWAVVTPDGLFDASAEGRRSLNYVVGLEPISLEQMKTLYYIPGLLANVCRRDELPKVQLFSAKDLYPEVRVEESVPGKTLTVHLRNRGGGIGQAQVIVNGKEFIADARSPELRANPAAAQTMPETTLTVDLTGAPLAAGENKIEVVARNLAGYLSSRTARGEIVFKRPAAATEEPPHFYAIIAGVSRYENNESLDLGYAAKDAKDFAHAIELGANELFGKERVHIRLLISEHPASQPAGAPSTSPGPAVAEGADVQILSAKKKDFEAAFNEFRRATPKDVLLVYLAGHGVSVNLGQQAAGDTYLYLTQEATTTDRGALTAEGFRRAMTVSSDELARWVTVENKALKQVLVLDTCAAGALGQKFQIARDLPPDQVRAIERFKDRTGFFVLMGSAADMPSYEASQYGQGLLTHALLQAMKGATKLRDDVYADVNILFSYAQETVPQMARDIKGVQRPLIISPAVGGSFDLGKFTHDAQNSIHPALLKPLILQPQLLNADPPYDNEELTPLFRRALRELSFAKADGVTPGFVFLDADEMSDAVKPSGTYSISNGNVTVKLVLVRNNMKVGDEISVTGTLSDKANLIKRLADAVTNAIR